MIKKHLNLILLTFLFCGNVSALSLEDAVSQSLLNNLSLKIEESNLSIAEEEFFQSKADFLPSLLLSGSVSETDTSDVLSQSGIKSSDYELSPSSKSIILSQTIFNGYGRSYRSLD